MMRKLFTLGLMVLLMGFSGSVWGQTNPAAQSIPYNQDFSTLTGTTPAYPDGFQGWDITGSLSTSYPTAAPNANRAITVTENTTTSRHVGDFTGKMGLMSTGSALASICLAINTTGKTDITVSYKAMTQRTENGRENGLGLQYRVGTSGTFTNIALSEYKNQLTPTNTTGTGSVKIETISVVLPVAAENQSVVQLRWVIRDISGGGNRPGFAIDDISIGNASVCGLSASGLSNVTCSDNGTQENAADDKITFQLNPTGVALGATYSVDVNTGTISPTTASYGSPTTFTLQPGSAGGGDVTVTITDVTGGGSCTTEEIISDPGICSLGTPCGEENFTNIPTASSSNYLSRTWTGTNGATWTASEARTDQTLNGKAICFNTSGTRIVTSPVYSGGIGYLSFSYVRGFTGTNARTLQVWVNGTKIGSDITVSPTSNTVQNYLQNINVSGAVQIEIRSTGAGQVIVDDIAWYCNGSTPYFRTKASGEWTNSATWEASSDNTNWGVTIQYPLEETDEATIQSGHTVDLNTNASIGELALSSGKLVLGSNNITVATPISTYSSSGYVVTDGAGVLTQNVTGSGAFFPVGSSTSSYDPAEIIPTATSDFSVRVRATFTNAVADATKVTPREWNITPTTPSETILALTHDASVSAPASGTVILGHYVSGAWEELDAEYSAPSRTYTAIVDAFSPFGGGVIGGFVTFLPVRLSDFTAKVDNNQTRLTWATATEQNNSHFLIQRSVDGGRTFETIGQVAGRGDSNERVDYTYVDQKPATGTNYYRLHQFDYDGTNEFFGPVSVVFAGKGDAVRVWPTLAENELTIETTTDSDDAVLLSVYDLNGRLMLEQIASEKALQTTMSVAHLPAGAYFIRWQQGSAGGQVRFVKL